MARTTSEVLIGPGTLYIAPLATAFPIDPTVTPAGTWVDVGYSEEGWTLAFDTTVGSVMVAELRSPIDRIREGEEVHLRGAASQASLENLQLALGGGTITTSAGPPATKTLSAPSGDGFTEKALLFRTKAPAVASVAKVRDVKVPRAMALAAVEMIHRRGADNKTVIAQDWLALVPATGNMWDITDTT